MHEADMTTRRGIIRKYPVLSFVLLTLFISHVVNPVVVELVHIMFPGFGFDFPPAQLNERSLINQYGGTIAALLITLKLYGVNGLRTMLGYSRITQYTLYWLLIAALLPVAMILLSYSLAGVTFGDLLRTLAYNFSFYLLTIGGFILSAGLAEEFGWRGFLLPQLLRTWSPLKATLISFVIISIWHLPALIAGWKDEPLWPWLILSLAIAVVHSWLFFKSGGNLFVVIIFHACFDAQYSFFSRFVTYVPNAPFHQGWVYIISYLMLALIIVVSTRGRLGYNKRRLDPNSYFGEAK
jgi:membrane protease YdiL (CAAX protease family)